MKKLLLVAVIMFLAGCTDPTHKYRPVELPDRSKGEVVKYEGVSLKTRSNDIAFEAKTADSVTLYYSRIFCYDRENDYLVFPKTQDVMEYTSKDGLYMVVPRDSVTLCKNAEIKNNSYFVRNRALLGFASGATILGLMSMMAGVPIVAIAGIMGDGSGLATIYWTLVGTSAAIGGLLGTSVAVGVNGEVVADVQETCSAYYTEEEMKKFLENNLCY